MADKKAWLLSICFGLALMLIGLLATCALAGEVTATWSPSEGATGYKIYYGTATRDYLEPIDVGDVTMYKIILSADLWYFAVTAYNECGESAFSEEVSGCVVPLKPTELSVQ